MENIEVRPATEKQARTVAKLNEHVHKMYVDAVPTFFKKKSQREAREIFEQILAVESCYAFIAWHNKTAVGYILSFLQYREETPFTYARRFMIIDQVSVNPDWHGQGIGRLLFKAVLEVAKQHNIEEIDAPTWFFNTEAHAFFETFGFELQLKRFSLKLT